MNVKHFVMAALLMTASPLTAQESDEANGAPATEATEATETPIATPKPSKPKTKPRKIAEPERRWRFAIGLGYQLVANEAEFDDTRYTEAGTSISGKATLEYEPALAISAEGRYLAPNSWGFIGGLNYEFERELDRGSLSAEGETVTFSGGSNGSKIQFTTLYASAAYRWNQFYLPFGLNYSLLKFKPATEYGTEYSADGGLGAQLGAGWAIDEHWSVELYSWVTAISLKFGNPTDGELDFGDGHFSSLFLVGKYGF